MNQRTNDKNKESVKANMLTDIHCFESKEKIKKVLFELRKRKNDYDEYVFIINKKQEPIGFVQTSDLFRAKTEQTLKTVMSPLKIFSYPEMNQEKAANIALNEGLPFVPVINHEKKLIGVLPPTKLMQILRHEHIKDINLIVGIKKRTKKVTYSLKASPIRHLHERLPWLLIGLGGCAIATVVSSYFELLISETIALVFFIPGIVYIADAVGTQTESVIIRNLSLTQLSFKKIFISEFLTGALIGSILGGTSFLLIYLVMKQVTIGLIVGLTILFASIIATSIGLLFPWFLNKIGKDPAYGSGPTATVTQDVLSLITYFLIATAIL